MVVHSLTNHQNNTQTSFDSHLLYTTPTAGLHVVLNFESEVNRMMMVEAIMVMAMMMVMMVMMNAAMANIKLSWNE